MFKFIKKLSLLTVGLSLWFIMPAAAETTVSAEVGFILNTFLFIISWVLLSISSFQAGYQVQTGSLGWTSMFFSRKPIFPPMPTKGLFKLIRHPIYLSFCLVLWTPPTMTLDLFLVALTYTFYCFFAPRLKERRFIKIYGEAFLEYKQVTPYFFPKNILNFLKKP